MLDVGGFRVRRRAELADLGRSIADGGRAHRGAEEAARDVPVRAEDHPRRGRGRRAPERVGGRRAEPARGGLPRWLRIALTAERPLAPLPPRPRRSRYSAMRWPRREQLRGAARHRRGDARADRPAGDPAAVGPASAELRAGGRVGAGARRACRHRLRRGAARDRARACCARRFTWCCLSRCCAARSSSRMRARTRSAERYRGPRPGRGEGGRGDQGGRGHRAGGGAAGQARRLGGRAAAPGGRRSWRSRGSPPRRNSRPPGPSCRDLACESAEVLQAGHGRVVPATTIVRVVMGGHGREERAGAQRSRRGVA